MTELVPKDLRLLDNRVIKDCLWKMIIPGILLEVRSNLRLPIYIILSKADTVKREGGRDLRGSILEVIGDVAEHTLKPLRDG